MVIAKSVKTSWNLWEKAWLHLGNKSKRDYIIKTELVCKNKILPSLGFNKIIRFGEQGVRHGFQQRIFCFDFYCEKGEEKWLIDTTMVKHKRLDKAFMKIFRMIQPKLKFGVIHVKRDCKKYVFKEIPEKQINSNTKNIVTRIIKDDFVFGRIKDVPYV